jgi:GINS complex subunit 1
MQMLYAEALKTKDTNSDLESLRSPEVYASMYMMFESIQRNKRCMLAYIMARVKRLQTLRWDVGAVLPPELKANLSSQENVFFSQYNKNPTTYQKKVGIDLSADLHPPKELFIQVRCLKEHGEIFTENGSIKLEKGTQHFVRRSDVELLIRQGVLQHIL